MGVSGQLDHNKTSSIALTKNEAVLLWLQYCLFRNSVSERFDFAPERHLRLELAAPVGAEAFAGLGRLDSCCDCEVNLRVHPDELTAVVAQLLDRFQVRDLEVSDSPIDQLIGDLVGQGKV